MSTPSRIVIDITRSTLQDIQIDGIGVRYHVTHSANDFDFRQLTNSSDFPASTANQLNCNSILYNYVSGILTVITSVRTLQYNIVYPYRFCCATTQGQRDRDSASQDQDGQTMCVDNNLAYISTNGSYDSLDFSDQISENGSQYTISGSLNKDPNVRNTNLIVTLTRQNLQQNFYNNRRCRNRYSSIEILK